MSETEKERQQLAKTKRNCKILAIFASILASLLAVEMKTNLLLGITNSTFASFDSRLGGKSVNAFISKSQNQKENFAKERTIIAQSYIDAIKQSKSIYEVMYHWNKKTKYFDIKWKKNGEVFFDPQENDAPLNAAQKMAMVSDEIHNLLLQTPSNKRFPMLIGYLKQKDAPILNYHINYSQMKKHVNNFIQIGEREQKRMPIPKIQRQYY